jgi:hypothetical protein
MIFFKRGADCWPNRAPTPPTLYGLDCFSHGILTRMLSDTLGSP